jgi:hypothetical protein
MKFWLPTSPEWSLMAIFPSSSLPEYLNISKTLSGEMTLEKYTLDFIVSLRFEFVLFTIIVQYSDNKINNGFSVYVLYVEWLLQKLSKSRKNIALFLIIVL